MTTAAPTAPPRPPKPPKKPTSPSPAALSAFAIGMCWFGTTATDAEIRATYQRATEAK